MSRLLVSNCTLDPDSGGIYLVDMEARAAKRIHDQPVRGLTHGPDGRFYFVTNKGTVCSLERDTWKTECHLETNLRGSHDLKFIDGHFYLVMSHGNQVIRLDERCREVDRFVVVDDPGDVCHANCLLRRNGELLLSIFTFSPRRREHKRRAPQWLKEGKILALDWQTGKYRIVYEPLAQPHSLATHEGHLYCAESFYSSLVRVGPGAGEKHPVRKLHGFVRGLAFHGDSAYVGISRRTRNVRPLRRFVEGFKLRCGVVELDPRTWRVRRQVALPGTEVYEILPVDA